MLIEVAALLVTYVGIKLHKKYEKAQQQQRETQQAETEPREAEHTSENIAEHPAEMKDTVEASRSAFQAPQEPGNTRDNSIARYQHYREMSLFTMGLVALRTLFPFLGPVALASYIYTAFPVMEDVEKALVKDRNVNVDVLFFIGNLLAISIDQFFPVSFGLWVRYTGRMGVEKTKNRSHTILTNVFAQLPHTVWVLIDQVEVEVPLQDVRANDIVIAKAGEVIPVDGLITEGMASIDQHVLTGESQPAEKETGEQVYANTLVLAGRIHIRVERSGEDTRDEYFYEVLPEEKARLVEQLQQQNRSVCFVGDGINDALAMQQAHVSISLAGATTMATDVADIIFMDGTLQHLDDLFEIAHKLDASLKKCLKFVAAPGIINLAGAFVLQYNIMTAALVSSTFGGIAMADVMKPLDPSRGKFQNPLKTLATGDFFEHPEKKE